MQPATKARSPIDPTCEVNGEARISRPMTSCPAPFRERTSASPRWPALPVTRIFMFPSRARIPTVEEALAGRPTPRAASASRLGALRLLELDLLRALPQRHLAEFGEVLQSGCDRDEMVAGELAHLAGEMHAAIGE